MQNKIITHPLAQIAAAHDELKSKPRIRPCPSFENTDGIVYGEWGHGMDLGPAVDESFKIVESASDIELEFWSRQPGIDPIMRDQIKIEQSTRHTARGIACAW